MDIAALSIAKSQASLAQAVDIKVFQIAQTQAQQQSVDLAKMLSEVQPHLGQSIDISV